MNAIRLAAATSAVLVVALLSVGAASGKPPGPAFQARCSDGMAGLKAAITAANSSGGGTIKLDGHCTYQLSGVDNSDPMTGDNALPVVTTPITIDGPGATIAGDGSARILEVSAPDGSLTLKGLTLTGGFNSFAGGAVFNNEAVLDLDHVVVTGNVAGAGVESRAARAARARSAPRRSTTARSTTTCRSQAAAGSSTTRASSRSATAG